MGTRQILARDLLAISAEREPAELHRSDFQKPVLNCTRTKSEQNNVSFTDRRDMSVCAFQILRDVHFSSQKGEEVVVADTEVEHADTRCNLQ